MNIYEHIYSLQKKYINTYIIIFEVQTHNKLSKTESCMLIFLSDVRTEDIANIELNLYKEKIYITKKIYINKKKTYNTYLTNFIWSFCPTIGPLTYIT